MIRPCIKTNKCGRDDRGPRRVGQGRRIGRISIAAAKMPLKCKTKVEGQQPTNQQNNEPTKQRTNKPTNQRSNETTIMTEERSYLQQRVYDLMGLSPDQCAVPLYDGKNPVRIAKKHYTDDKGVEHEQWLTDKDGNYIAEPFPLFQSDKHDNIQMYPYTLDGQVIKYLRDKQPKHGEEAGTAEDMYCITRMNPQFLKENPSHPKYKFPGGQTKKGTYPFFPPELFKKFQKKERIETLVLTEGYMKAMCASVRGVDIVGLGSITLFADSKTKQLYPDIVRLINTCQPRNIVVLYDGDCRDLSKEALESVKNGTPADLSKRPQTFRASLVKLRDLLLEFKYKREDDRDEPCELFFAYVNKMREDNPPKGLDDLFLDKDYADQAAAIAEDLNNPGRPGVYFKKLNLRTGQNKISGMFGLRSPEKFYEEWAEEIGLKRFKYEGSVYEYSPEGKKLEQILDSNLDDFIAVGGEIVLVTDEPIANANGTERKFYPKPDKVINARFGEKTAQKIYRYKYYEDFTILPSHDNYNREVLNASGYKFYNMYSPLPYQPEQGSWEHIEKLLRQVTKLYGEEYYQMLLDWITLTYFKPFQFLPIIMLVSRERGTGKTSFLNLLKYIYANNAVIGGNDLIVSKFNTMLAGKLIVGVDESCLGENKDVGESLKYMSTSRTMHIEPKGKDKKEVPAFVKFVLCSNEVRKGIFIANDEIRFWVMRLTPWEDDNYDVEFDDKLEGEVPAFLYYLTERYSKGQMYVPEKEHRMWFHPRRLENDDLKEMMSGTQSNFEGSLREFLQDMFLDTKRLKLTFDVKYIVDNVQDAKRKDQQYIRNLLKDMRGVTRLDSGKYNMPLRITGEMIDRDPTTPGSEGEVIWPARKIQCRPYEFDARYFLSSAEYDRLVEWIETNRKGKNPEASSVYEDEQMDLWE